MRIAPGGHIAPRHIDRHQPLPRLEPRRDLGLELAQRLALRSGEAPYALGGELDIALDLRRDVAGAPLDLGRRHDDLTSPAVEVLRILPDRGLAALLDRGEHLAHDLARDAAFGVRRLARPLEMLQHGAGGASASFGLMARRPFGQVSLVKSTGSLVRPSLRAHFERLQKSS